MSDKYEIFSLDEIGNNDVSNIIDESVTDIVDNDMQGKLRLSENIIMGPITESNDFDNTENPVMMPVNGVVFDLSEDLAMCDEQSIEDITDADEAGYDCATEGIMTDIDGVVEDDLDCENTIMTGETDVDRLVEDSVSVDTFLNEDADVFEMSNDNTELIEQEENVATNIKFTKGMTLVEFLRDNPTVRERNVVEQYFTQESVMRALRNGTIMCMHGKISL